MPDDVEMRERPNLWRGVALGVVAMALFLGGHSSLAQRVSSLEGGYVNVTPAPRQTTPVLIEGGRVHTGLGPVHDPGYVLMEGGRISAVGAGAPGSLPNGTERVDARGRDVYPGLIVPSTTLGLSDVAAVRATNDYAETGPLNPNVVAATAYNAHSNVIPTWRAAGVLTAEIAPRSGLVAGTSSLVQLDAWSPVDATVRERVAIHINMPARQRRTGWWAEPGTRQANDQYQQEMAVLETLLADARAFAERQTAATATGQGGRTGRGRRAATPTPRADPPVEARVAAMVGLWQGNLRLIIHVEHAREIIEALALVARHGIRYPVIASGPEAARVAPLLATAGVPVILRRVHSLPLQSDQDIDLPYRAAAILREAGVDVCLDMSGDMEVMQGRNLPLAAGTALGYGLTPAQALEAITAAPARILGVDDLIGAIAVGRWANVIISEGSIFDARTPSLRDAWIEGRRINLDTHQKALYRQYARRYGQPVIE